MKAIGLPSALKSISLALGLTLGLSSCYYEDGDFGPCLRGTGDTITETRTVRTFDGIELKTSANVHLREGATQEVTVEGYENLVPYIETRVVGNTLIIDNDRCMRSTGSIDIYITLPELRKATVNGSGKIEGETPFETSTLALNIPGSGEISLEVDAEEISSTISGSGEIYLTGDTDHHTIRINGSGDVRAFDLESLVSDVRISGSGKSELTVRDQLDVRISGSGDVRYKGSPRVSSSISGSGKVIQVR